MTTMKAAMVKWLAVAGAIALGGTGWSLDYIATARYVDISNATVATPGGAGAVYYVGLFVKRDAGVNNIGSFSFDIFYNSAATDYDSNIIDISAGSGTTFKGVSVAKAKGTPGAQNDDGQGSVTNTYRTITATWDSTIACLSGLASGQEDGMVRVRFKTTAGNSAPVVMNIIPSPGSSAPLQYVEPNSPYTTGSTPANLSSPLSTGNVPVSLSAFTVE